MGSQDSTKHNVIAFEYEVSNLIRDTRSKRHNCDIYFTTAIPELSGERGSQNIESILSYNTMLKKVCEINNIEVINISMLSGKEELLKISGTPVFSDAGIRYLISILKNSIRNSIYRKRNMDMRLNAIENGSFVKLARAKEHTDSGWSSPRKTRKEITEGAHTSGMRNPESRKD